MNRFEINPYGRDFHLLETMPSGERTVIGRFATEEWARCCLMQRLTAMNAASLERWVCGKATSTGVAREAIRNERAY
jgi:hypothetical protein